MCVYVLIACVWCRPELWHFGLPPQEHFRLKTARSQTRASTSAWQSTALGLATRLRLTFMFEVRSLLTWADPSPLPFRSPPSTVWSSLDTSSALMLCLLTANRETHFLHPTAVKVKPVIACPVSALTLPYPALSISLSVLSLSPGWWFVYFAPLPC